MPAKRAKAKSLGALFDGRSERWYVPAGFSLSPFAEWLNRAADAAAEPTWFEYAMTTVGAPTVASHTAAPLGSRTPRSAIRQPHALQRHSAAAYARSATAAAHARIAIRQLHSTATPIG